MMIHLRSLRAFNNVTYPLNNGNKSQSIGNTPARARARVCVCVRSEMSVVCLCKAVCIGNQVGPHRYVSTTTSPPGDPLMGKVS